MRLYLITIVLICVLLVAGCTQTQYICPNGTAVKNTDDCVTSTTYTTIRQTPTTIQLLSSGEIKNTVYQAIRKYIPASSIAGFEYQYLSGWGCPDYWSYPQADQDMTKHVVWAIIQGCKDGIQPPSLEETLDTYDWYSPQEIYIKTLSNGKVLIRDTKNEFEGGTGGRYGYSIEFICQNKYTITIWTVDPYGDAVIPLYENYEIDKVAMENMANEILGKCSG